jgi:subtilisin-like proprotein convertase family protein
MARTVNYARIAVLVAVLCGLVAADDARAVAPPVPPGCPAPIATSHSNDAPTAIAAGTVVTSHVDVTGAGDHLTDLDVFADFALVVLNDLEVTLRSPEGTVATISTGNGLGRGNVFGGTTFDDQADPDGQVPYPNNPGLITDHPYELDVTATALTPEEALSAFDGEDPNGTWTLSMFDPYGRSSLQSWRLDIHSLATAPATTATSHLNDTDTSIAEYPQPAVVTSSLDVAGAGTHVTDLDLFTDIAHTWAADLDITLRSPAGTVATITTDNGLNSDNVFAGTTFDDQADPDGQVPFPDDDGRPSHDNPGLATDHPYATNVTATPLVPEEALSVFEGENPNGTWTLTISDDFSGEGGSLRSWRLDVSTGECPAPAPPPPPPPPPALPDSSPPSASPAPPAAAAQPERRFSVAPLSVFGPTAAAGCEMAAPCRIELRARGRLIAGGSGAGAVALELTAQGRRLLARRIGGVHATVTATAGPSTATARTRAILEVERVATPAGSWAPGNAVLTPKGRRFLRSLRGRLIAVTGYRCVGRSAAGEPAPVALGRRRARIVCRALRRLGAAGRASVVGRGSKDPVAANGRVEVSLRH